MYKLEITNTSGKTIVLSQNNNYQITEILGLNPPTANFSTTAIIGSDGAILNNARVDTRNIVMTLAINGDVEKNRIELYKFFTPKNKCTMHYKNGTRDVTIECYTENVEIELFSQKQFAQISLICLQPYFADANRIILDLSSVIDNFEFPFDIESGGREFSTLLKFYEGTVINSGEVETGVIIEMTALGMVQNPVIYDTATNEFIKLNFTMQLGDVITINTYQGQKSVMLQRAGETINIINYLDMGSTWLTARHGDNTYYVNSDAGKEFLSIKLIHTNLYVGV